MATPKKVGTQCYLKLEPVWHKCKQAGAPPLLSGMKVAGVSQRPPRKGYAIKLDINVPSHVFKPVIAEVHVTAPERAITCSVLVAEEEE